MRKKAWPSEPIPEMDEQLLNCHLYFDSYHLLYNPGYSYYRLQGKYTNLTKHNTILLISMQFSTYIFELTKKATLGQTLTGGLISG